MYYEDLDVGILLVTSPDKIYQDWLNSKANNSYSHIESKLKSISKNSNLITLIDAHSSSLSWIGSVLGHKVFPMGVNKFGKSGDLEGTNILILI